MKKIVYLFALFFIVACATKNPSSTSTPATPSPSSSANKEMSFAPKSVNAITADNFKSSVPDFTYADFSKGKSVYETNCDKCHALKDPKSFSSAEWAKYVPDMVTKFNRKFGQLDTRAEQLILGYGLTVIELR